MLQHVSLEVAPDGVEASVGFWELVGFTRADSPATLGGHVTGLEAAAPRSTCSTPTPPPHRCSGTRRLWGTRRAFAIAPGGDRVELMEAPPPTND